MSRDTDIGFEKYLCGKSINIFVEHFIVNPAKKTPAHTVGY